MEVSRPAHVVPSGIHKLGATKSSKVYEADVVANVPMFSMSTSSSEMPIWAPTIRFFKPSIRFVTTTLVI